MKSILLVIAAGLALSACGSEGDTASSPVDLTPSETATTTAAQSSSTPTGTGTTPRPRQVEASALLLTKDDLIGTGWTSSDDTNPAADPSQPNSQPPCRDQTTALSVQGLIDEDAAAWYSYTGDIREAISSQVYVYSDVALAISAMANYRAVASSCSNWQSGGTGTPYAFSEMQELFDASAGEETLARELRTASLAFPDIAADNQYWVATRNENIVVQTTYTPSTLLDRGTGRSRTVDLALRSAGKADS